MRLNKRCCTFSLYFLSHKRERQKSISMESSYLKSDPNSNKLLQIAIVRRYLSLKLWLWTKLQFIYHSSVGYRLSDRIRVNCNLFISLKIVTANVDYLSSMHLLQREMQLLIFCCLNLFLRFKCALYLEFINEWPINHTFHIFLIIHFKSICIIKPLSMTPAWNWISSNNNVQFFKNYAEVVVTTI